MRLALTLVRRSWILFRSQSSLQAVWLVLILLPRLAAELLPQGWAGDGAVPASLVPITISAGPNSWILAIVVLKAVGILGSTCVLVVGTTLLHPRHGARALALSRVLRRGVVAFFPVVITSVLRMVIALLWSFLLLVPGIIYLCRTAFYAIVIVDEQAFGLDALRRSTALTRGRLLKTWSTILTAGALLLGPPLILEAILDVTSTSSIHFAGTLIASSLLSLGQVQLLLSLILLYDSYARSPGVWRKT